MRFSKRLLAMLLSFMLVFALVACANADTTDADDPVVTEEMSDTTDSDADLQPDADSDEGVDSNDMEEADDDTSETMMMQASADSDYVGVTLTLDEAIDTVAPAGAAAGTLQLMVTFENTTEETVTLPFAEDDYIITDSAGLDVVPSTASPDLVMPEIEAGGSVSGTIEYAVTDAEGTYTFEVGDFQDITFSSNASDG